MTKGALNKKLTAIAREDPRLYTETVTKLKALGDRVATLEGAIAHVDDKRDTVASLRAIALFYRGEGPLVEHVVRNADGTLTVLRPSPDDPAPAPPRRTPLSDAAPAGK
jgi:hypothetical protein